MRSVTCEWPWAIGALLLALVAPTATGSSRTLAQTSSLTISTAQGMPGTRAAAATNTISAQAVYVTDSAQKPKSSFRSGDQINYHIDATNSSGRTLSVTVGMFAYVITADLKEYIIIDKRFNMSMAPGPVRIYTPSVIPAGAPAQTYKLDAYVVETSNLNNNGQAVSPGFAVMHVSTNPLSVPLYSQFWKTENPNSYKEDCGPTAVAMVVADYVDLYYSPAVAVGTIRSIIAQHDGNSTGGTNAVELEYALFKDEQIGYSEIANSTTPFSNVIA